MQQVHSEAQGVLGVTQSVVPEPSYKSHSPTRTSRYAMASRLFGDVHNASARADSSGLVDVRNHTGVVLRALFSVALLGRGLLTTSVLVLLVADGRAGVSAYRQKKRVCASSNL